MNNKVLSAVLLAGIATTGFAAISSANDTGSGSVFGANSEIRDLLEKVKNGEELTSVEQETLDEAKENFKQARGFLGHGKRAGFKMLTDEEKTALESMTDEEKKEFFDAKKEEMQENREARKAVIDALIAGQSLTQEQEALRQEMLEKIAEHPGKRDKAEVIEKLLSGEELTADDEASLAEMQEKQAEREEQRELMQPIFEKMKNGEELTDEEQALVDEKKSEMRGKFKSRLD